MDEINKRLLTLACNEWFTKTSNEPLFWEPTDDAASMDRVVRLFGKSRLTSFHSNQLQIYFIGSDNVIITRKQRQ